MAAGWRGMHPVAKAALLAGGSAVLSGLTYLVYKRFYKSRDDYDEGFEDVPATEGREKRVLVLGLDDAGKSSILAAFGKQSRPFKVSPTEGFHVIYVQTEGKSLIIWEIGGAPNMRSYWKNFIDDTRILVYVVDASNPDRFEEARDVLKNLLQEKVLNGVGVVLVANKQDVPGAKSSDDLKAAFDMPDVCVMETQVPPRGEQKGIKELQNLLASLPS